LKETRLKEGERSQRRTIQDALEVLRKEANFADNDQAKIRVLPMGLPSGDVVSLVDIVFAATGHDAAFVASLPTSASFQSKRPGRSEFDQLDITHLNDATIDAAGNVLLSNGTQLRAVEVIPALLPYELTDLDYRILHATISKMGAEDRCYRSLRYGLEPHHQRATPDIRFIDFGSFSATDGRPQLKIPLLKEIEAEFSDRYPDAKVPSARKIADTLRMAGLRLPRRRPRTA